MERSSGVDRRIENDLTAPAKYASGTVVRCMGGVERLYCGGLFEVHRLTPPPLPLSNCWACLAIPTEPWL